MRKEAIKWDTRERGGGTGVVLVGALCCSETSVLTTAIWRHIPEDNTLLYVYMSLKLLTKEVHILLPYLINIC
jgi:hypothetical protein